MNVDFGQLCTAMATPFTSDDQLNFETAVELGHYLIENGTDTLVLSGTTGESPTLTHSEDESLFKAMVTALKGKVTIMAGTGSNCTRTAIENCQKAEAAGVDSLLQVVPYYNKPSQEGLIQHFTAIAGETSLPIMLYNIPGRTGINMLPETVVKLAELPNIVAIKEAAGSIDQVKEIRALTPDSFKIYSGDDALTLDFMAAGAVGVVSVASHIVGKHIKEMMACFNNGDSTEAREIEQTLSPLFEVLFIESNPVPVKYALGLLGFPMGAPRLPLVGLSLDAQKKVEECVDRVLGVS